MIIGIISGLLVVGGVLLLDKLEIDDPRWSSQCAGLNGAWERLSLVYLQMQALGPVKMVSFFGGGFSIRRSTLLELD